MKKYLGILVILVAVMVGCGKKELKVSDFSAVKVGMSQKEVKELLGKPTEIEKNLDNERVTKNLAPFKEDILQAVEMVTKSDELTKQLDQTLIKISDGAEVTYYNYDYPSTKEKDEEMSTSIIFCDDEVTAIIVEENLLGLYGID